MSLHAAQFPVFSAPGTNVAAAAIGEWAGGRKVFIGLDSDDAGEKAVIDTARQVQRHWGTQYRMAVVSDQANDFCDVLRAMGPECYSDEITRQIPESE